MRQEGKLELILGTMFSGKSSELIRRVNRYEIAGKKVLLFNSGIDNRYGEGIVSSHDALARKAVCVRTAKELIEYILPETQVIGIDEIQFFDSAITRLCHNQASQGRIIIASGLYKNFRDEVFPFSDNTKNMADLLAIADDAVFYKALCTHKDNGSICGRDASRVQRFQENTPVPYDSPVVLTGGKESYAPRCREHFVNYKENKHLNSVSEANSRIL